MKKTIVILVSIISSGACSQIPSNDVQIKTALLAAPADKRANAMVYGYNQKGDLVVLRKGTNEIVCLGDDPKKPGLNVSCYHKDLEPFMARGRELSAQGKTFKEIFDIREAEAKSGKLKMPKQASNLQVYSASAENYNAETGEVKKRQLSLCCVHSVGNCRQYWLANQTRSSRHAVDYGPRHSSCAHYDRSAFKRVTEPSETSFIELQ